jgi:hypothetical protein
MVQLHHWRPALGHLVLKNDASEVVMKNKFGGAGLALLVAAFGALGCGDDEQGAHRGRRCLQARRS